MNECTLVTAAGRRPLRSANNRTCVVKRSRNQFNDRCFGEAAGFEPRANALCTTAGCFIDGL